MEVEGESTCWGGGGGVEVPVRVEEVGEVPAEEQEVWWGSTCSAGGGTEVSK